MADAIDPGFVASVVALRREIHANPEPGFEEHETQQRLKRALADMGRWEEVKAKAEVHSQEKAAAEAEVVEWAAHEARARDAIEGERETVARAGMVRRAYRLACPRPT